MEEKNANFSDFIALQQKQLLNVQKHITPLTTQIHFGRLVNRGVKTRLDRVDKEIRVLIDKFIRIPMPFIMAFDQESYLNVNADVRSAVASKAFDSALEHFVMFGYEEVRSGKRRIGTVFPFYRENDYLRLNPKVAKEVENGVLALGFEHFLESGYAGFLRKERRLGGRCPQGWNQELAEEVRQGDRQLHLNVPAMFESDYVLRNSDISHAFYHQEIDYVFKYFLLYGIEEILRGTRAVL